MALALCAVLWHVLTRRGPPLRSHLQHVLLYNVKGVTYNDYLQPLERAEMVREGNQVTILTYSRMRCVPWRRARASARHADRAPCRCSYVVEQAVKEAVAAGYDPEVIDLISLKPFDQHSITVRAANSPQRASSSALTRRAAPRRCR